MNIVNIFPDPITDRDFTEDFEQENGCYYNNCCLCGEMFKGNKHRVICKLCSNAKPIKTENNMSIIEKLGITPLNRKMRYVHCHKCGTQHEVLSYSDNEVQGVEQQRNDMLEMLTKTTKRASDIVDKTGDKLKNHVDYPDMLKAIKIIEKADPQHRPWSEIKELI